MMKILNGFVTMLQKAVNEDGYDWRRDEVGLTHVVFEIAAI